MASTGSVSYARTREAGSTASARNSGSVSFYSSRSSNGARTDGVRSTVRTNDGTLLPSPEHPFGKARADGTIQIDPAWYKFFAFQWETKLGGFSGKSLPDVATTVITAQAIAVNSAAEVSAIGQQTQANAESLSVVVQVAQNNALSGADQIPPVRLSPGESVP